MQTIAQVARNRTTIQDIARELNITTSTVSRALRGHPSISDATTKSVTETALRLNYRPNHIAAALRSGKSNIIGVVVPFIDRAFFGSIIRGIEDEASKKGYGIIVCQTYDNPETEKRALETLLRLQVDGILASVAQNQANLKTYKKVKEEGILLIFFDRILDQLQVSTILIDDFKGGYIATKHLIDQGCKKIAHFAGDQNLNIYRERLNGYKRALEDANIPLNKDWILECASDVELGKAKAEILFSLPETPDSIFSSSDFAALGAMQILKSKGVKIPQEVALVGFANEPFTSFIDPSLTTIDQHTREMGKLSAKTFLEEIENQKIKLVKQVVLQPEIIVRASSLRRRHLTPISNKEITS